MITGIGEARAKHTGACLPSVSSVETHYFLYSVHSTFVAKTDLRLFTVKGGKFTDVNKVQNHVKKLSRNYVIVRERNKATTGFHFHALLDVLKEPPHSWFKKGVHMNLIKVGRPQTMEGIEPPFNCKPTKKELKDQIELGDLSAAAAEEHVINNLIEKTEKKALKQTHLTRVLAYLSKELPPEPKQYQDYIYVVSGKSMKVDHQYTTPIPSPG